MDILIDTRAVFSLVFCLLSAVIALYLASRKRKVRATRLLAGLYGLWAAQWFYWGLFPCLIWDRWYALAYLVFPFHLTAYAVHLHFAYAFRGNPYPREAKVVVPLGYGIALLFSLYPIYATVVGLATGVTPHSSSRALTLLAISGAGVLLLWSLAVYLRKSVRSTRQAVEDSVSWTRAALQPVGREARAHRAFLLPWSFVLVGLSFSVVVLQGSEVTTVTYVVLFLLHLSTFILVYFTFAPEPTSVRVKLSGAALIATLAAFAVLLLALFPNMFFRDYDREVYGYPADQTIRFTPQPGGGFRVERLPLQTAPDPRPEDLGERLDVWSRGQAEVEAGFAFPFGRAAYDTLFVGVSPFVALGAPLRRHDLPRVQFFEGPQPKLTPLLLWVERPQEGSLVNGAVYARREPGRLTLTWHDVRPFNGIPGERNTVQLTLHDDGAFAFHYPHLETAVHTTTGQMTLVGVHPGGEAPLKAFRVLQDLPLVFPAGVGLVDNVQLRFLTLVHERLMPFVWAMLGVTLLVLAGFPLLLRTSLTTPLARLLEGIRSVDAGERDLAVPVGAEDEVGELTHHFNSMTASLAEAEADLRAHAERLEERVAERTAALEGQTERLERQTDELEAARAQADAQAEALRELDALKSQFFANVSHELRTPLTLLLGPVKDALDPDDEHAMERLRAHLPLMARNGERLLTLIGQLLDLAKLEGGGMHLHAREFDLVPFAGALADAFAARAERLGLALVYDPAVRSLPVWADPDKLEKVIVNLLSNALKFTPEGGKIRVRVGRRREPEGERAEVTVQDTGRGIPAVDLPRIFERFHQIDASDTRAHEGAGIGLALARELIELHRGTLTVESTEGFGSMFSVRLPLGCDHLQAEEVEDAVEAEHGVPAPAPSVGVSAQEQEDAEAAPESAPLVLVVEDNADMRAYLRSLLTPTYRVAEAAAGNAGLDTARRLGPDLVVSDVMMPGTDGLMLCQALKSDTRLSHVPVVLLTARADEKSRLEGLGVGADAYLAKPFSAEELLMRAENLIGLRRLLRERFGGRVIVGPTEVEVPSKEAVWLADVRDVVEAHIGDSEFGVERLADELAMSTRQLQRRMKTATDLTPNGFIRMLRLERAAQLLEQGVGGVAEVAYRVGFRKPDYFSKQFGEVFGVPPSVYAERNTD